MPLSGSVQKLLGVLRSDATESAVDDLVQCVILDERDGAYAYDVDVAAVRKLGVEVVRLPLVTEASHPNIDADSLSKVLVSIGG